jgi:hypothetical protein
VCQWKAAKEEWRQNKAAAEEAQAAYRALLEELEGAVQESYQLCCQLAHMRASEGDTPYNCQLTELLQVGGRGGLCTPAWLLQDLLNAELLSTSHLRWSPQMKYFVDKMPWLLLLHEDVQWVPSMSSSHLP